MTLYQKCYACERCKSPGMSVWPTFSQKAKLQIIGDYPNYVDTKSGVPFDGKAGTLLKDVLTKLGINPEIDVSYAYVLCCQSNTEDKKPKKNEIDACSLHLWQTIYRGYRNGVKVIVAAGTIAYQTICGSSDGISSVSGMRREVEPEPDMWNLAALYDFCAVNRIKTPEEQIKKEDIFDPLFLSTPFMQKCIAEGFSFVQIPQLKVVPSYSPSYFLRPGEDASDLHVALRKAWRWAENKINPVAKDYAAIFDAMEAIEYIDSLIKMYERKEIEYVSYDLETVGKKGNEKKGGLNPFERGGRILTINLSYKPHYGRVIYFCHPASTMIKNERDAVAKKVCELLEKVPIVGANLKFDVHWSRYKLGAKKYTIAHDCVLMNYAIYLGTRRNGLKILTSVYTDADSGYEDRVRDFLYKRPKEEQHYGNIPPELMTFYACADVDVVMQLIPILIEELKKAGQYQNYLDFAIHPYPAFIEMEQNGCLLDKEVVSRLEQEYREKMTNYTKWFMESSAYGAIWRNRRHKFLWDQQQVKYKTEKRRNRPIPEEDLVFNFNSASQVAEVMYDIAKVSLPENIGEKKDSLIQVFPEGVPSTANLDIENLLFNMRLNGEVDSDRTKLIEALMDYRKVSKRYSSYLKKAYLFCPVPEEEEATEFDYDLFDVGCQRADFNLHSTRTGRTSCIPGTVKIKTPSGNVQMKDVKEGDIVFANNVWTKVLQKFNNGIKKRLRITLDTGDTIECSPKHKIYATPCVLEYTEWFRAKDIKVDFGVARYNEEINKFEFNRVVNVEKLHPVYMYDMETEAHCYMANGILVHNCSKQNLQQVNKDIKPMYIPRRIPSEEYLISLGLDPLKNKQRLIMNCDVGQAELRMIAVASQDTKMLAIMSDPKRDIHREIASVAYHKPQDQITSDERKRAKSIVFGCVPMDTEALTSEGWKKYEEINEGDLVLGYKDGVLVWTPVRLKVFYENAPLMRLYQPNRLFSVTTTPNHRWVCERRSRIKNVRKYRVTETTTEGFKTEERLILSAPLIESFDPINITEKEAAIVGWLHTDGSVIWSEETGITAQGSDFRRRGNSLIIYQSSKKYEDEIDLLLDGIEAGKYSQFVESSNSYRNAWRIKSEYARDLWDRARLHELTLWEFVLRLNKKQRDAFLDAANKAEGHTKNRRHKSLVITQNTGIVADSIELAGFLSGFRTERWANGDYKDNTNIKINISSRYLGGTRIKKEDAGTGDVWCIKTDCETWVMRQDERIMLTGNTVFGRSPKAIAAQLKIPEDEAVSIQDALFSLMPEVKMWIQDRYDEVDSTGYVITPTGRKRNLLMYEDEGDRHRRAQNTPAQEAASSLNIWATGHVHKEMKRQNIKSLIWNFVHDSNMFDVFPEEIENLMVIGKYWFCKQVHKKFPWYNVPLVLDFQFGTSWGTQVDVKYDYDTRTVILTGSHKKINKLLPIISPVVKDIIIDPDWMKKINNVDDKGNPAPKDVTVSAVFTGKRLKFEDLSNEL